MDQSYRQRNDAERARLTRLVASLSDEQLARDVRDDGWTVAAMLAHLAFWDRMRFACWELWEQGDTNRHFSTDVEQDMINSAGFAQWLALPPREAARQAVEAAEAVDRKIASLPADRLDAYMKGGGKHEHRMVDRSIHRKAHIDEIAGAL
ncbi:MAG: maleylpyruvate isomerase N-terminal domain-containing protein [Chloroflexi bacterium]|nr:maleylpyruvate isomerase N-terminal domain-containing protein [Chloroflexota bacterium]